MNISINYTSFFVWVLYLLWNYKGIFSNFAQNILPTQWKMWYYAILKIKELWIRVFETPTMPLFSHSDIASRNSFMYLKLTLLFQTEVSHGVSNLQNSTACLGKHQHAQHHLYFGRESNGDPYFLLLFISIGTAVWLLSFSVGTLTDTRSRRYFREKYSLRWQYNF